MYPGVFKFQSVLLLFKDDGIDKERRIANAHNSLTPQGRHE